MGLWQHSVLLMYIDAVERECNFMQTSGSVKEFVPCLLSITSVLHCSCLLCRYLTPWNNLQNFPTWHIRNLCPSKMFRSVRQLAWIARLDTKLQSMGQKETGQTPARSAWIRYCFVASKLVSGIEYFVLENSSCSTWPKNFRVSNNFLWCLPHYTWRVSPVTHFTHTQVMCENGDPRKGQRTCKGLKEHGQICINQLGTATKAACRATDNRNKRPNVIFLCKQTVNWMNWWYLWFEFWFSEQICRVNVAFVAERFLLYKFLQDGRTNCKS